ncbi:MAG: general secretion pathway protein GspE [Deltaproteobacteria bacterium]|nr:general secretion pathway protein GspE [Deltaproteobacteria bacterium]
MIRLGEFLVASRVCTGGQVRDALRHQVVLGGRLGTNLLELGLIDESTLARYLSKQHRLPALCGDKLQPDPKALQLLPPSAVDRLNSIPYRLREQRLQILCLDPHDEQMLAEVRAVTGCALEPIVVPEFRFNLLLTTLYRLYRSARGIAVDLGTPPVAPVAPQTGSPSLAIQAPPEPLALAAEPAVDLMSEEAFFNIYQTKRTRTAELPVLTGTLLADAAAPAPTTAAPAPAAEPPVPELAEADLEMVMPAPPPRDESPLDFQSASQLLAQVRDRDQVAHAVLRFARSDFRRALLFTVHRAWIVGWDAIGVGMAPGDFSKLVLPLSQPSVFATVVKSRAHYLGGLPRDRVNVQFLGAIGRQIPASACVLPISVGGQVLNIFYGDNGHRRHCPSDIGELLILALKISQSYEALFRARFDEAALP